MLAYQVGRMIIKNGEMNLLVADTDQAIDLRSPSSLWRAAAT